jgi:hypothetical protein
VTAAPRLDRRQAARSLAQRRITGRPARAALAIGSAAGTACGCAGPKVVSFRVDDRPFRAKIAAEAASRTLALPPTHGIRP